jgi:Non-ribosomal peptide synthetase modules and related proteins
LVQVINENCYSDIPYLRETEDSIVTAYRDFIQPFDLSKAPLIRISVVETEESSYIFFDEHHIISDGASLVVLQEEFMRLYNGEELPALRVQYKDYSEWMKTRDLSDAKAYWNAQFEDDIPVLDIPTDHPRPNEKSFKGGMFNYHFRSDIVDRLKEVSAETGATEFMLMLSAYMITLSKYSKQEDVVVGTPISGRTHKDTESMLGMFVNTLALRGRPEAREDSWRVYQMK